MSPIRNGFTLCIPPWHCSKGHSLAVEDDCRHLFRRLLLGPNAHDIHDAASHASEDVTHRRVPIRTKYQHHSTPVHCNQKGHPTCKREAQDTNHSITLRPPRIEADPYPKKIRSTRASDGRYLALLGMGLEARQIAVAHREIWIYYLFTCSSYL